MQWNEPETFHILLASVSIAIWEPYDYGQIGRSAQACAVHLDLCLLDGILSFLLYLQFTCENSFRITDLSITCPSMRNKKYAQNEWIVNRFPLLTFLKLLWQSNSHWMLVVTVYGLIITIYRCIVFSGRWCISQTSWRVCLKVRISNNKHWCFTLTKPLIWMHHASAMIYRPDLP